jgi:hypothetical protein
VKSSGLLEPLTTDRVRTELERVLPAGEAARAMLSALAAWGPRPPQGAEVDAFVGGPLRTALERLFSRDRSAVVFTSLQAALSGQVDRPTPVVEIDDRITGRIPLARNRPVPVLVVARTSALADRLQVIAKGERAAVSAYGTLAAIERAVTTVPLVIVLDASDPPDLPAEVVVSTLARGPAHAHWIVWGAARAHGQELAMLAELAGRTTIALREDEGIATVVDVILARRA